MTSMEQVEPFVRKSEENLPTLYKIQAWEEQYPFITAGITSRVGGNSKAPYESLNMGLHVGDDPADVIANRMLFAKTIGMPFEACTYAEQIHSNKVAVVSRSERGKGRNAKEDAILEVDVMVTDEPDICLCVMYADCVPLYFVDPIRQVIALAHAGWKGTSLDIVSSTIRKMTEMYGSNVEDIKAVIGPSIGDCCYEVNQDVIDKMANVVKCDFRPSINPSKYMLNLQEINRLLMIKAGILSSNIEITNLCTSCHTDHLFSHRAEKGKTGRMVAWLAIQKMNNQS